MNMNNTFETTDFQLATFLLAKNTPFLGIRNIVASTKNIFVFEQRDSLPLLIENFWVRKDSIEPILLLEAQRRIKPRLYDEFGGFQKKERQDD